MRMRLNSNQVRRIKSILILFLFLFPAAIPMVGQQHSHREATTYNARHSSFVLALVAEEDNKEEEKKEKKVGFSVNSDAGPLLNSRSHVLCILSAQKDKSYLLLDDHRFAKTLRLTLLCTLLI